MLTETNLFIMIMGIDSLFKQVTELIADTDFTGYTIQYPPLFTWGMPSSDRKILKAWKKIVKCNPNHLGLYFHFPYCKQRCSYCRYFSVKIKSNTQLDIYLTALMKEIEIYSPIFCGVPIYSLYFGGGTPSLLSLRQLDRLFVHLYKNFNLSNSFSS